MHKNNIGSKLRLTVSEKWKLREFIRKRGNTPLYQYFHPLDLES